jgi:hypothetical protein
MTTLLNRSAVELQSRRPQIPNNMYESSFIAAMSGKAWRSSPASTAALPTPRVSSVSRKAKSSLPNGHLLALMRPAFTQILWRDEAHLAPKFSDKAMSLQAAHRDVSRVGQLLGTSVGSILPLVFLEPPNAPSGFIVKITLVIRNYLVHGLID